MALKVLHLSTYDTNGGAARAAYSLHGAMLSEGLNSQMWVARKGSSDPTVHERGSRLFRLTSAADRQLWRLQRSPLQTWRSPGRFACLTAKEINRSDADVVNLHWITDGFLSIEEIGKITKPIVWSMYDMWPFSGTEHYGPDGPAARWRHGYTKANRSEIESGFDLDRWVYQRKSKHWGQLKPHIHMVPASTWLESATRASALMHDWPQTRIPHLVDTDVFRPQSVNTARSALGLPQGRAITFLSSAGIDDQRKGWDLLVQALPEVKVSFPDISVLFVGPVPGDEHKLNAERLAQVPIYWHGRARSSSELRLLYSAGDVTAVPSREDNMPLTAMEAQSCGRPVVGFRVGGLPDIIEHEKTGWLATPGHSGSLANAVKHALTSPESGLLARDRATALWSPAITVRAYENCYRALVS